MTHDSMIEVIAAHRDGKEIEFRGKSKHDDWDTARDPCWDFLDCEYRIKPTPPKPREWKVPYKFLSGFMIFSQHQGQDYDRDRIIHVREVLE